MTIREGRSRGPLLANVGPLGGLLRESRILPNAKLNIRPEEGHLGGLGATDEIFEALLGEGFNDARERIGRARSERVRTRRGR